MVDFKSQRYTYRDGSVFPETQPVPAPLVLAGGTREILASIRDPWSLLTSAELDRAEAFRRETDRLDFVAAHVLVRVCAACLLGSSAENLTVKQRCDRCGGSHGRPFLGEAPSLYVSLSHTRRYVAAAVGSVPVGVDVERYDREVPDPAMLTIVLSPREIPAVHAAPAPQLAFLRQWVRKEAMVKMGITSIDEMATLDLAELSVDEDGSRSLQRCTSWNGWRLLDWLDPAHQVIGTAVASTTPHLAAWGGG